MIKRVFSRSRRVALAGGAALVLGGAAAASAVAQQQQAAAEGVEGVVVGTTNDDVMFFSAGPPADLTERRQAWLKGVAGKLGVTPERLDQAIQDTAKEQGLPPPLVLPGPGLPIGAPGAFSVRIDAGFGAAAQALGISEDQLHKESVGKSLADVARAHNVDPKVVADALKAQRRADLEKAIADGKLPTQIADRLKANLDQEIDRLMQLPGPTGKGVFHFERSVIGSEP
jgi:hypothetical protein